MRSPSLGSTAVLATIVLLASACGGSSDNDAGGQDGADFCEKIVALEAATSGIEGDNIDDESLDELRSIRDSAPDEVRDDMTVLIDLFEKLADFDESDPASAEEAFGLLFDPAVIEAGENLEAYGVNECGLDPETSDTGSGSALDDSLYNPDFDDPVDPNVASLDGLKLYFDENYQDAAWRTRLSSFGQFGDDFEAGGIDVEADAIAICEAVLAYATGFAPDATAGVNTFSDNFGDETPVATGNATDGCVLV